MKALFRASIAIFAVLLATGCATFRQPPFMQTRRSNISFKLLVGPYQFTGAMMAHASARSSRA